MLESYIRSKMNEKDILLMTHLVLGYPSFDDSFRVIRAMVEAGVDLMELQIPFSEPIADGPVILRANQKALEKGASVQKCLDLASKVSRAFDIPFLVMSYYNIFFKYGTRDFVAAMAEKGLQGAIIPDLPPEEGREYLETMERCDLSPIQIFSPTTSPDRMKYLAGHARGFVYCVARKGVTGTATSFSKDLAEYLSRCRKATPLPLALGFGIKEKADIDFLKGKADIAVIGTQTIRIMEKDGVSSVGDFIRSLREP
ncbi:MAG: tryptophan synthase subunit alpha [Desulfobacterales bacterium]|nr:tryptophan synthase subunit alpha [Desulfobacterales bacterium]